MSSVPLAAAGVVVCLVMAQVPAQQPPPATPPASSAKPAPAPALEPPVLPRDARQLVDQSGALLIRQLLDLYGVYLQNQRPDDAAAVLAQVKLLQKVTGIPEDPSQVTERPKVYMNQYRDRVGQSFVFTVTGSADEMVWGTDIYTDDTALEGAAVHAGVLRSGQTGEVTVTVLPGQAFYQGSRKNGIDSMNAASAGGSFRLGKDAGPRTSRPTSLSAFRGRIGEVITVPAVGAASGSVWGTDPYTDDSNVGAAAVHAGILRVGEFGFVKITMLPGEAAYIGSTQNGVTSQNYGAFGGSFRLSRAPQPWVLKLPDDAEDGSGMVALPSLRKEIGVSFSVKVVGGSGPVRGSGIYSDDSSIAAAAVHAGVLKYGEAGWVRVTITGAQDSYTGTEQNGVRAASGGPWPGSFRVDRGSGPR